VDSETIDRRYGWPMAATEAAATDGGTPTFARRGTDVAGARLLDLGLWVFVAGPIAVRSLVEDERRLWVDLIAAVVTLGLIVVRGRWPVPTWAAALVGAVVATVVVDRPTAMLPLVVVLLFHVSVRSDRRTSIRAGAATLAVLLACVAIIEANDLVGPEIIAALAWPGLAVAAGDAVRSRREAIAAAEERAERAERSREDEARRRVAEERLHIARDLHDVVAHRIAVVNVQAGVAAHLLRSKPDEADVALATVRSSARMVLDELAGILSVLRADGDEAASVEPAPTLDDLATLVASFAAAGLSVTYETTGVPGAVAASTALAVYRTVQEALTNAHKHGDGAARLRISYRPDAVEVRVANRARAGTGPGAGSGFGLMGMRERVGAAGGALSAGQGADGSFCVEARFPVARSGQRS
jgi:signal transduction histidine kinase